MVTGIVHNFPKNNIFDLFIPFLNSEIKNSQKKHQTRKRLPKIIDKMTEFMIGHTNSHTTGKQINCIKGKQLDCLIEPVNGVGGVYLGNIEAAKNLELLDSLRIRSVLTMEDSFDFCYFGCKVSSPALF